ncbi:MAG: hypothetical protein V7K24_16195 [Nostoc sp.]
MGIGHWALGKTVPFFRVKKSDSPLSTQHSKLSTDQGHWVLIFDKGQKIND